MNDEMQQLKEANEKITALNLEVQTYKQKEVEQLQKQKDSKGDEGEKTNTEIKRLQEELKDKQEQLEVLAKELAVSTEKIESELQEAKRKLQEKDEQLRKYVNREENEKKSKPEDSTSDGKEQEPKLDFKQQLALKLSGTPSLPSQLV